MTRYMRALVARYAVDPHPPLSPTVLGPISQARIELDVLCTELVSLFALRAGVLEDARIPARVVRAGVEMLTRLPEDILREADEFVPHTKAIQVIQALRERVIQLREEVPERNRRPLPGQGRAIHRGAIQVWVHQTTASVLHTWTEANIAALGSTAQGWIRTPADAAGCLLLAAWRHPPVLDAGFVPCLDFATDNNVSSTKRWRDDTSTALVVALAERNFIGHPSCALAWAILHRRREAEAYTRSLPLYREHLREFVQESLLLTKNPKPETT
jgi:hypothetical protein